MNLLELNMNKFHNNVTFKIFGKLYTPIYNYGYILIYIQCVYV